MNSKDHAGHRDLERLRQYETRQHELATGKREMLADGSRRRGGNGEKRPPKNSGWREWEQKARALAHTMRGAEFSVWRRRGVVVISTIGPAPSKEPHTAWSIIVMSERQARPSDEEIRQASVCFEMTRAVEQPAELHAPGYGMAPRLWLLAPTKRAARVVHRAGKVSGDGDVSARCFKEPRAIDMTKESWTTDAAAVTCGGCLSVDAEAPSP